MKKVFPLLLAMILAVSMFSLHVLGASVEESELSQQLKELPIEEVVDYVKSHDVEYHALRNALFEREWASYEGDKEFARHYAEDPDSATEMIRRNVDNQLALIQEETLNGQNIWNSANAWFNQENVFATTEEEIALSQQLNNLPLEGVVDYVKANDVDRITLRRALLEREVLCYKGDKEFAMHYAENPTSAMAMIQRNVDNQLALIQEETEVKAETGNSLSKAKTFISPSEGYLIAASLMPGGVS